MLHIDIDVTPRLLPIRCQWALHYLQSTASPEIDTRHNEDIGLRIRILDQPRGSLDAPKFDDRGVCAEVEWQFMPIDHVEADEEIHADESVDHRDPDGDEVIFHLKSDRLDSPALDHVRDSEPLRCRLNIEIVMVWGGCEGTVWRLIP